jgi:hypothetical protein
MIIHVECLPDETLVKVIVFATKKIIHHQGKSRVFAMICDRSNQIAVVDEDPDAPKHKYERELVLKAEEHGIKYYFDSKRKNKVFVLKVKLEDWIISICKKNNISLKDYGLPEKANDLHRIINYRLPAFEKLLNDLKSNRAMATLIKWINEK